MPLYEYECQLCAAQFQKLVMNREQEERIRCPECRGADLKRLISRVAYHVSEKDRINSFDPSKPRDDAFYRDSRNIGLSAKKRAQQMGIDLGSGFEDKLDRLRSNPGSVINDNDSE
jgi:putative FmdB family regulatory protein